MYFDKHIGLKERKNLETITRESVKCISVRDGNILMIETNRGFLAFAGGKIEKGESQIEALKREVLEETGYKSKKISDLVGKTFLRRMDKYDCNKLYEATCHYYICDLSDERGNQCLTENEMKMDVKPIWISIDKAMDINEAYQNSLAGIDYFIEQQNFVLSKIDQMMKEGFIVG